MYGAIRGGLHAAKHIGQNRPKNIIDTKNTGVPNSEVVGCIGENDINVRHLSSQLAYLLGSPHEDLRFSFLSDIVDFIFAYG